ncbi:hypothetical protein CUC00_00920 [Prevotella intermedia]|uniref:Uncharacterized protein n=1 Tax=Prevotella intermedia TaxID=28131 RepID=A0A2D3LTD0_PREIN|nr:hypothetical protein CTM44_09025 [Prevotella intermedia]ATV39734.1 hypothetical protein CUC00_00920 [Prevotella intermedia]PJI24918.1 hypothetical protein CTM59_01970 [Prevotella intermedia]
MQNLLFCVPKAAVLHGKSVGFATQKSRFRNAKAQLSLFKRIIFTKPRQFSESSLNKKGKPFYWYSSIEAKEQRCFRLFFLKYQRR